MLWLWWAAGAVWMAAATFSIARRHGIGPVGGVILGPGAVALLYAGSRLHYLLANAGGVQPAVNLVALLDQGPRAVLFGPGVHVPGGMLLVFLAAWFVCRRTGLSLARVGDQLLPALAPGFVLIRLGCFSAGCCFGVPTEMPWGVRFPVGTGAYWVHSARGLLDDEAMRSLPVHPTQLYFAAVWLAVAFAALAWKRRQVRDGEACLLGLVVWGIGQVIVEGFRDPDYLQGTPYLRESGIAAVLLGTLVLSGLRIGYGRAVRRAVRPSWQRERT